MKFKRIMLVTFVLLAILTIGAVSAADDINTDEALAADDSNSIESAVDDVDLLSDGDDVDYGCNVAEQVDKFNESQEVVSVVCPENATGKFVVQICEDENVLVSKEHGIEEEDYNNRIIWTVNDLDINWIGSYGILLYHLTDVDDEIDDETEPIMASEIDVIDSRDYRIEGSGDGFGINCLYENPLIFSLYCPDEREGDKVNVTVTYDENEESYTRTVNGTGFIDFYANDLNMALEGEYYLQVKTPIFEREWLVYIENPVSLSDMISLNSILDWDKTLVMINVPVEIRDGRIVVEVDGTEVFNETLGNFSHVDDTEANYYWHHPMYGPGDADESINAYNILGAYIDGEKEIYWVSASLILENHIYTVSRNVTVMSNDVVENEGVAIQMADGDSLEIGSDYEIAYLKTSEGANGTVVITANGEVVCEKNINEFMAHQDVYRFIYVNDLEINEPGEFEIEISYFKEGSEGALVSNSANYTFYSIGGDEEDEGDDEGILYIDEGNVLVGGDREVVGLNTEKEMDTGRLVVFDTDTNETYFDKNLSDMEYNTNWMKYKFNAYNGYYLFANDFNVPSGRYNINATYYNDDGTINETVIGTVNLDVDSYINTTEMDINDDEAILVNVHVFDWFEDGAIVIGYYDNGHVQPLLKRSLNAEDINTTLSFKLSDLELDVGNYEGFYVGYLQYGWDEENDEDIYFIIGDTYLSVVDNTVFRAFVDEGIASIFSKEDLFQVYCPISSANTNMTIKVNDNEVITHFITESEAGGYIGFNLSELGIDEIGEYSFDIYDNGECLLDDYYYEFGNPFEFSEFCINGTDDDSIVVFRVPEGFNEGSIRLTDADNNQLFSSDLSDMEYQDLPWDKGFIRYVVVFDDLNREFEAGIYTFYAEYIGEINVNNTGDVRIIERKYAENENASIEIFDYNIYDLSNINYGEPESIAEVRANNDEGYVNVIIGDETFSLYCPSDDDDGIYIYRVAVDVFDEFDEGVYPIEVIYYNGDGDQVLNLSSMITFIQGSVDVYVESYEVIMGDGWNDSKFLDLKVFKDFRGSILIKLDDEEYIMQLSDLASAPDDNIDIFVHYSVTFNDLNKTDYEEREYDLFIQVFEDENDEWPVWSYDNSKQISFYKQQMAGDDYVTIEIDPTTKTVPYGQFIYITANDDSDNVTIYIDDSEDPISIRLSECAYDEELVRFVIGCEDLNLDAGDYTLNVTYGTVSLIGQVSLVPNLNIFMPGDDEIIYNGYDQDPAIITFNLRDGNIYDDPISGNVTVLIYLDGENPTVCFEGDIADIDWDGRIQSKAIRLSQLDGCSDLNGTYKVEVRYENGTEVSTGAEGYLVFKTLDADDFAVETSGDKIIFTNIPEGLWGIIEVTVDGEPMAVELWVIDCNNEEQNFIKIRGLSSASQVSVVFKGDEVSDNALELLNIAVSQIDPALTISVANITYGDSAIVTVTTNNTFSGDVLVQIGNLNLSVSVTNGSGSAPVSGLAAGDYVAKAFFDETEVFSADEKNTTFTVNKMETSVSQYARVLTTYYSSGTFVVCLYDANGNPIQGKHVTFVLGGYSYEGVTNAKGRIYVTTPKKLTYGKYSPTLTFDGDENYTGSNASGKLVVFRATPVMKYVKKVTYKRSGVKKYTIVLKSDLGVRMANTKVVLRVNNVNYKGFTDNKGKLTFNLKKLTKKGIYTAYLKYGGDKKRFEALNIKIKITVK